MLRIRSKLRNVLQIQSYENVLRRLKMIFYATENDILCFLKTVEDRRFYKEDSENARVGGC